MNRTCIRPDQWQRLIAADLQTFERRRGRRKEPFQVVVASPDIIVFMSEWGYAFGSFHHRLEPVSRQAQPYLDTVLQWTPSVSR